MKIDVGDVLLGLEMEGTYVVQSVEAADIVLKSIKYGSLCFLHKNRLHWFAKIGKNYKIK